MDEERFEEVIASEGTSIPPPINVDTPEPEARQSESKGMNLKPKRYDGSTSWNDFIRHFERVHRVNRWPEEDKLEYLMVLLDGDAASYAEDLTENEQQDYWALCRSMDERFGDCLLTQVKRAELKTRRRKEGETLASLAQELNKLANQAYPRLEVKAKEELTIEAFIHAVDDREIRMALHQRQPRNVWEAVKVAVDLEAWKEAESKGRTIKGQAAKLVQKETEKGNETLDGIEKAIKEMRMQMEANMKPKKKTCYGCKQEGHFVRDCPQRSGAQEKGFLPR